MRKINVIPVRPEPVNWNPSQITDYPTKETSDQTYGASHIVSEFLEDTTLHGSKFLLDKSGNPIRRLIWATAIVAMAVVLGIQIHSLITHYYAYPIQTTIKTLLSPELPFPAVTLCNLSPYSKRYWTPDERTFNLFLHMTPLNIYENKTLLNCSLAENEEFCNSTYPDVFELIGHKLKDIVGDCRWHKTSSCMTNMTARITDLGKCFTFNHGGTFRTGNTGSQKGLWMYLNIDTDFNIISEALSSGMKIVVHHPDDEPDVMGNGVVLAPGFASYIKIKPVKYIFLPKPYKAFGDDYCLDTKDDSFVNPLLWHSEYSRYGCLRECELDYIIDKCQCKDSIKPGNATTCSMKMLIECVPMYTDEFDDLNVLEVCNCSTPCEIMTYEIQVSVASFPSADVSGILVDRFGGLNGIPKEAEAGHAYFRRNTAELRVYFDRLIHDEVEQVPVYDLLKVIGSLGGQMGLFLGASLLSLGELGQLLVMLLFTAFKRLATRNKIFVKH